MLGVCLTDGNSMEAVTWFHPDYMQTPIEAMLFGQELNMSRAIHEFFSCCFLDNEGDHLRDPLKFSRDIHPMNWYDRSGRVPENFSRLLPSPDVVFANEVLTEADLPGLPTRVLTEMRKPPSTSISSMVSAASPS
jgi:hypothetical protein